MAGTREADPDLSWLIPRLRAFWLERKFTDVTVTVQNEDFHCHRLVLTAFSRVLKVMLRTNMREGNERKVKLGGVTALTFQRVLNFLYGVDLVLDDNSAVDLLQASDMLDIPSLKLRCAVELAGRLSLQNCVDLWTLARTHDCPPLAKEARACTARHFRSLCKTPDFLALEPDQLESLLGDDRLGAPVEEEVFYALSKWVALDPQAREKHVDQLLELVRFPLMDSVLLNESIARRVAALRSERGLELLREAQDYHSTSDIRHLWTSSRLEPRADSHLMAAIVVIGNQLGSEGCFSVLAYSLRERVWRATTRRVEMAVGCAVCPWRGGFYSAGGLCSSLMCYYELHSPGPSGARSGQGGTKLGQGGVEFGRQCAPIPDSRIHHGLLAFGRRLFLFGGWQWHSMALGGDGSHDGHPSVLEYAVNKDAWRVAGTMVEGRERILGYVRDRQRILAYCPAPDFSLKYYDTETHHSALLTRKLAQISRLCGRHVTMDVFDTCPFSHHHVMVTGCGDVIFVRPECSDDVTLDVSHIDLSQELKMYSVARARGCLYVLGGLVEEGDRQETVSQCQGLGQTLTVVRVPGPYTHTWAYSSFYMNVHKSHFQKILSKAPASTLSLQEVPSHTATAWDTSVIAGNCGGGQCLHEWKSMSLALASSGRLAVTDSTFLSGSVSTESHVKASDDGCGNTTSTEESSGPFKTDMIQGLAIGFGAMVGGIILLCIIWFLCCGNACQKNQAPKPELRPVKGRVAPSPTQRSGAVTRSNIRASS